MDPDDIVKFAEHTIEYLTNDKVSFESVLDDPKLAGKLGFAMICTAMAAFDVFAWILYQSFDLKKQDKALFNQLLNDSRFFKIKKYHNARVFYGMIRCGVIHQLYPKYAGITAQRSRIVLCQDKGVILINAYGLYCDVLEGCQKIADYFRKLPPAEKEGYSLKLWLRRKIDEAEYAGSNLDISTLPPCP
jgi:hypothetical protein